MIAQREPIEKIEVRPQNEMAEPSMDASVPQRFIDYPTPTERIAALDSWLRSLPKHEATNISNESLRRENLYEDRA